MPHNEPTADDIRASELLSISRIPTLVILLLLELLARMDENVAQSCVRQAGDTLLDIEGLKKSQPQRRDTTASQSLVFRLLSKLLAALMTPSLIKGTDGP